MAELKKEEVKPKGPLGKLKEAVDDKDEQMAILSTFVRLGILIWAGGILTLNYVTFPGFAKQDKIDPTFIASVFTGVLATFGVQTAKSKQNSSGAKPTPSISKKDMEMLIEKASQTAPAQVVRIEQAPLNITANAQSPKSGNKA